MYLYGASGHARVIMDIVEASSNVNVNENENCCSVQGGVFCNENGNENDLNDNENENWGLMREKAPCNGNENENYFNGNVEQNLVEGLFDDNPEVKGLCGVPVSHEYHGERPIIVSIGNNAIRKKIVERIVDGIGDSERLGADSTMKSPLFGTALHPSAVVSPHATIGEGSVVMPGAIINHSAQIGRHCIVNTGASIDHECQIGDFVHISPHATLCGNVSVGEGSWVGAGAVVIPGIKIGRWAVVGAGAVVVRDVPDGVTVVGCPAKEKRKRLL